jgi:hypothetical protein
MEKRKIMNGFNSLLISVKTKIQRVGQKFLHSDPHLSLPPIGGRCPLFSGQKEV